MNTLYWYFFWLWLRFRFLRLNILLNFTFFKECWQSIWDCKVLHKDSYEFHTDVKIVVTKTKTYNSYILTYTEKEERFLSYLNILLTTLFDVCWWEMRWFFKIWCGVIVWESNAIFPVLPYKLYLWELLITVKKN